MLTAARQEHTVWFLTTPPPSWSSSLPIYWTVRYRACHSRPAWRHQGPQSLPPQQGAMVALVCYHQSQVDLLTTDLCLDQSFAPEANLV